MIVAFALLAVVQAAPDTPPAVKPARTVVDPARLVVATRVAGRLLPDGTYRAMMKTMTDQMVGMIKGQMGQMPVAQIAKMVGVSEQEAAALGPATIKDVMETLDPAYDQRMQITMRVMFDEMGQLMSSMEPEYRAGLAEALASRFSQAQLDELDRFFATPTGASYAGQSMALYTDPALMTRMQAMMPRVMAAMPGIMQKVEAATASLPKVRDTNSLSKAEQARLATLLSPVEPKK